MSDSPLSRLSRAEIEAEAVTPLPDKEVISLLDLNVDLDLALDLAAPIDLAVAANANVAAPIDAAVAANVLSLNSSATALADQGVMIDQHISGDAIAEAPQDATLDQSNDVVDDGSTAMDGTADAGALDAGVVDGGALDGDATDVVPDVTDGGTNVVDDGAVDVGSALDGDLLNVDVNAAVDADIAAPIAGAVAANANVAAPIDAAVAANIGSVDSTATAVAQQDAIITQDLDDVTAEATADQTASIEQ
jgi:hypothetical protein